MLSERNLTVPRTWAEVLHVARLLNNTDLNGDSEPDWGICIEPDTCACVLYFSA